MRVGLLHLLAGASEPLSALEILTRLRESHPRVGAESIYRNLFVLATCGLVSQLNLQSREAARFELQEEHHHHAICLGCGTVVGIDACPTPDLEAVLPDFAATSHVFEVYGYCRQCRQTTSD